MSTLAHPTRYLVELLPEYTDGDVPTPIRTATVEDTGRLGASGYPRYAGHGVVADIDPATGAVEAVTVDDAELEYGLTARARQAG
ncbi:hypothetical protein [Phaeacidiphilus oryzae]|uniref:hypothetical protein n=1 Tax=Phaeacidiphilus oryzae TaxID=348818 RepID=UPI0005673082|nr:hypothetical protein [Phaeacidiphilus oryzae]